MNKKQLKALIIQFRDDSISDEDLLRLKQFLDEKEADELLMEVMDELGATLEAVDISGDQSEKIFEKITAHHHVELDIKQYIRRPIRSLPVWMATACLMLFAAVGYYFYLKTSRPSTQQSPMFASEIKPGGSKAKVKLDDGKIIDLETLKNDTIIYLSGYAIRKNSAGVLSYEVDDRLKQHAQIYNTIVTPPNGEYNLILPDGTKIWVNSSSELRYPLNFSQERRIVELKGEAYFEVTRIKSDIGNVPFTVKSGSQELQVLGTTFNVQSNQDKIKTTLLEGSVKLSYTNGKNYLLKPNQQASYDLSKEGISIREVDPFYITAWKNGSFAFDNASIREVMQLLSQWYTIEVEYLNNVEDIHFTGTLSRYERIEKVLQAIEMTGSIRFRIEGRRITVMK